MRIGIDLCCWSNQRGYGRYTRNLVSALVSSAARDHRHAYLGIADRATVDAGDLPDQLEVVSVPLSEAPTTAAAVDGRRRLKDVWRMSRAGQRADLDVMFFPSNYTYFPVVGRARTVVVIHDAIAEQMPQLIFPSLAGRLAWAAKQRLACWQALRVVTVSQASARAIAKHLPIPAGRLRVIYEAADSVFGPRETSADRARQAALLVRLGIPRDGPYILYVGGFGPHKNVGQLLDAFSLLTAAPVHLVLVGKIEGEVFHSEVESLRARVHARALDSRVTFTGFLPDVELVDLYAAAECLVLPSRDEGFGLPVVEAMACGTPVVASRAGALPELVQDGATGLLVDVDRPDQLAAALRRIVLHEDPGLSQRLRTAGLNRAAEMSWVRAADELQRVFDEIGPTRGSQADA